MWYELQGFSDPAGYIHHWKRYLDCRWAKDADWTFLLMELGKFSSALAYSLTCYGNLIQAKCRFIAGRFRRLLWSLLDMNRGKMWYSLAAYILRNILNIAGTRLLSTIDNVKSREHIPSPFGMSLLCIRTLYLWSWYWTPCILNSLSNLGSRHKVHQNMRSNQYLLGIHRNTQSCKANNCQHRTDSIRSLTDKSLWGKIYSASSHMTSFCQSRRSDWMAHMRTHKGILDRSQRFLQLR